MKKLMVIAAGILQVPVIKKAREMGCYVIAVDGNPDACGLQYADKAICANIISENDMLCIAREEKIDGVIHPCSEVSMNVMGRINDEMGLSGITRSQAIKATNKYLMRKAFEEFNAPSPKSFITTSCDDAWFIFCNSFDASAILKPSRNSGSRGIAKIEKDIIRENFDLLYERALKESRDHTVLIEQFIEGPEFSVEIIVWNRNVNVLAITDKKTTGAPHFVELGHNQPSCFPENVVQKVKDAAVAGVKALGIDACACHAEVKYQNGNAYLMEIGARMGGDFISTILTVESTGIDMVAASIDCALGNVPNLTPQSSPSGVCIRYFTPSPGKLLGIHNIEALNSPNVISSEIYCKVGDQISEVTSSICRSGHLIVKSEDVLDSINKAEAILSDVVFEVI